MGEINNSLGNYLSSLQDLSKAIDLDPSNIMAFYQKGITFMTMKKYDSAILYYNMAIHGKGSDTEYFELNKNNPLYNEADHKYDVDMSNIRFCRGFAFYMLRNDDNALKDFEFCLSNGYNNSGSVFFYCGIIHFSKGDSNKACSNLRLALQNGYTDAQKYILKYCK